VANENGLDNPPAPEIVETIRAVVARAKAGDDSAVPLLRELLTKYPILWQRYGDLAAQAEGAWVALAAGQNLYLRESLARQAAALRQELAGPSPSALEKLLVERVVACWLQLHYFDCIETRDLKADDRPRLAAFRAKRQEQAHRMYLTSLAALTTLRKLLPGPGFVGLPAPDTKPTPDSASNGHCDGPTPVLPHGVANRLSGYFDDLSPAPRNGQGKRELEVVGTEG
jgi:hypothetical protein